MRSTSKRRPLAGKARAKRVTAVKQLAQGHEPAQANDLWTWIVIALIFGGVTLALYGPLVWQVARSV